MKALVYQKPNLITFESIADPIIEHPQDVIVKIKLSALCGSDLHIYHGRELGLDSGTVMGHEFVGEVTEVGQTVKNFKIGDLVFSPFNTSCGQCYYCQQGLTSRCVHCQVFGWRENSKGLHGGQAEYVRVPLADTTLVSIPADLSLEKALLLGDNFTTGYFCASLAEVKPEACYVVLGCGSVGLMSLVSAKLLGAQKILAYDPLAYRLKIAEKFGARACYSVEELEACVQELTQGRGADSVLEAVGLPAAQELAFKLIRPGGILAVVGVHSEKDFSFSPKDAYNKNVSYRTGRCPVRYYLEKTLPLVSKQAFDLDLCFSHKVKLQDGVDLYQTFAERKDNCVKVLLEA